MLSILASMQFKYHWPLLNSIDVGVPGGKYAEKGDDSTLYWSVAFVDNSARRYRGSDACRRVRST